MMYRLRAALQGFCRRLSRFMTRHFIDRKSEWADVEELGENVGQDARFLPKPALLPDLVGAPKLLHVTAEVTVATVLSASAGLALTTHPS